MYIIIDRIDNKLEKSNLMSMRLTVNLSFNGTSWMKMVKKERTRLIDDCMEEIRRFLNIYL